MNTLSRLLLVAFCLLPAPRLPAAAAGERHNYHVDAAKGDDTAPGTLERPWKTLASSIPKLKPGDTLLLRGRTFFEKEISIGVQGTAERPITIRSYPGETPVIDGALPEFREPGNDDWELVDKPREIYVSKKTYPDPKILHGYFEFRSTLYKLVGYDDYADFSATNEFAGAEPFYVGQGAHWRKSDGRIYVRMAESALASANGYNPPGFLTDPRKLKIFLSGNGTMIRIEKDARHVHLEGLDVQGQEHALEFSTGAGHIAIRNCRLLGGRFNVVLGRDVHDVLFDGITIDGAVPDWIAWLDVKTGRAPAKHLQSPGLKFSRGVHHIEVRNCTFRRLFDAINANDAGHHLHIHHNLMEDIRDDCFQLGTYTHEVEFAYNRMIRVSKGPSFQGRGDSEKPGTKYYHHNILDCSKLMLFARKNADGSLAKLDRVKYINDRGEVWARPAGSHGDKAKDPWKIYHNTILFGQELNGTGSGMEYMHGDLFDPSVPQEVYNNIIIQLADYWLSSGARVADGSQIFDGNLYFRMPTGAKQPLLRKWSAGANGQSRDFQSLEEFKASPFFAESKRIYPRGFENSGIVADPRLDEDFRPAADGPAAAGAVKLPESWPGVRGERFRGAMAPPEAARSTIAEPQPAAEYYVDAATGDDAAAGTIKQPWRTVRQGISRLKPGDTLFLRGGTFFERNVSIAVRGTADRPITIRNFPGESPIIDGAFREFRQVGNEDWELADAGLQIYRSKRTYPFSPILHGYFEFQDTHYRLVGYDDYADLAARSQFASNEMPFYVGPGAHWKKTDGKIYVRLTQTDIAHANGYALPNLPTDPRRLKIILFGHDSVLRAERESAHVQLEGLMVQGQEHALEFAFGGASHYLVKNCRFLGGRFQVHLGPHTHHIVFDGITIDGGTPDWIAWLDVKVFGRRAGHMESPGIRLTQNVHHIEIRNSTLRRLFDGINSNDGGDYLYVHHNLFEFIRDDCLQLGTHTHDVEVAYNRMINVSKGPGHQGRGNSARPGTKYYHHNVIDCSKQWLFARRSSAGGLASLARVKFINGRGEVWARPVGSHGARAVDPWKVYHNTIIFGQELNGSGNGLEYMHGTLFDPATPHQVFNNVVIQVGDYWMSSGARVADGSQIFDGNLYHRARGNAKQPFLRQWTGTAGARDFASLDEFKASPLFADSKRVYPPGFENSGTSGDPQLDRRYQPASGGPAATGAVPLPPDWPGNRGERFRGAVAPRNETRQAGAP